MKKILFFCLLLLVFVAQAQDGATYRRISPIATVSPSDTVGKLVYWNGSLWSGVPAAYAKYDPTTRGFTLGSTSAISIGEHTISRLNAGYLQLNNGLYIGADVEARGSFYSVGNASFYNNVQLLNKTGNGFISFATRNTAGSEAKYDLTNTGDLSQGVANYHYFGDATTDGSWRSYVNSGVYTVEYRTGGVWVSKMTLTP